MRAIAIALTTIFIAAHGNVLADCGDVPEGAETFVRDHKVYHFNGDPPSRVQDELALWKTKIGSTCFLLRTIGPNYHQCEVSSVVSAVRGNELEFKKGSCTLTFQKGARDVKLIASPGWERIGRGGVCPKNSCGMYGEIESGTFRAKR